MPFRAIFAQSCRGPRSSSREPALALAGASGRRSLHETALVKRLGDPHGVGRGALMEAVGDYPHVQSPLVSGVTADAPDEHLVTASRLDGHRVDGRAGSSSTTMRGADRSSSLARSGESRSRVWTLTASE